MPPSIVTGTAPSSASLVGASSHLHTLAKIYTHIQTQHTRTHTHICIHTHVCKQTGVIVVYFNHKQSSHVMSQGLSWIPCCSSSRNLSVKLWYECLVFWLQMLEAVQSGADGQAGRPSYSAALEKLRQIDLLLNTRVTALEPMMLLFTGL
jgi:hypothetical protein